MYIREPAPLTEIYVDNHSNENKYRMLINANFQDYLDSLALGGQFEVKSLKLKQRISALGSGIGMAAGALGGPAGIALGFAIGNTLGKYAGGALGDKVYGKAIADMADLGHEAKVRHSQMAAYLANLSQVSGGIDTLRQNENKRLKDDLQAMQV